MDSSARATSHQARTRAMCSGTMRVGNHAFGRRPGSGVPFRGASCGQAEQGGGRLTCGVSRHLALGSAHVPSPHKAPTLPVARIASMPDPTVSARATRVDTRERLTRGGESGLVWVDTQQKGQPWWEGATPLSGLHSGPGRQGASPTTLAALSHRQS